MKKRMNLNNRIEGCLLGAAIGAELAVSRAVHPEWFDVDMPNDLVDIRLLPPGPHREERGRVWRCSTRPFIELGVTAYLQKRGRVTPEDFAEVLKNSPEIVAPAFVLDNFHNVQELLREGMHPRLSGLGNAPCGLLAAAMPAVGIYHLADPERAYLDGVELASVAQPRLGADWAALCAAAVAAAFTPGATPDSVVATVLKIAHQNNQDLFRICAGWDPRITGHWSVVTGSTVMCLEPVGLFNIGDPECAFIDAMAVAFMYQRGLDMWAAASMAATVAEALRPTT